jgi:hypothetical protein
MDYLNPGALLTRHFHYVPAQACVYHRLPTVSPPTNVDIYTLNINTPIASNEEGDMVLWYSTSVRNHEHRLSLIET